MHETFITYQVRVEGDIDEVYAALDISGLAFVGLVALDGPETEDETDVRYPEPD